MMDNTTQIRKDLAWAIRQIRCLQERDGTNITINQDNKIKRVLVRLSESTPAGLNGVISYINNNITFTVSEIQNVVFLVERDSVSESVTSMIDKYLFTDLGKGTYGFGATPLTNANIELVYRGVISSDDVENLPSTQIVLLGNVSGDVSGALNNSNPPIVIQSQNAGYVLIRTTEGDYLFLAEGGTYGLGQLQTTSDDFQLLSEEANTVVLTTTGTSGPSTLVTNTLNIPRYDLYADNIFSTVSLQVAAEVGDTITIPVYLTGGAQVPTAVVSADAVPLGQLTGLLSTKADLVGGLVPSSQLPSSIDDVLDGTYISSTVFNNTLGVPYVPMSNAIYVDTSGGVNEGKTYRWSGTAYVGIGNQLALGITSSTAYRGDFGNTAYLHSQITGANPHLTTLQQITAAGATTTINTGFGGAVNSSYMMSVYDAPGGGGFGSFRATNASGTTTYVQMRSGIGIECNTLSPIGSAQFNLMGNTITRLYNSNANTGQLLIGNNSVQTSATLADKTFITFQDMVQPFTGTTSVNWNLIRIASTINLLNQSGAGVVRGIYFNPTVSNIASNQYIRVFEGSVGSFHINTTSPQNLAVLQADSTTQGFLKPRMTTTQRDAIVSPPEGLEIYNLTTHRPNFFDGTIWQAL